jgi:hypothetical protein
MMIATPLECAIASLKRDICDRWGGHLAKEFDIYRHGRIGRLRADQKYPGDWTFQYKPVRFREADVKPVCVVLHEK